MAMNSKQVVSFLLAFLFTQLMHPHCCMGDDSTNVGRCRETEREALLQFKGGLHDPAHGLSSWAGEDCCAWHGVRCHNRTGHVLRLDLRNPHLYLDPTYYSSQCDFAWGLYGEINPSLLRLTHLKYLDLSANCFDGTRIPKFIGSFKELRYLNLSSSGFGGVVPHELGNLSSLRHLDLSIVDSIGFWPGPLGLHVDNLQWLSRLDSLQYLDMSGVDLNKTSSSWVQQLNSLPSLRVIRLEECSLDKIPLSLPHNNLTSLSVLDLWANSINSTIPNWVFNMSGLQQLNLRDNWFSGLIPVAMGKAFPSLEVLDLSYNDEYLRLGNISESLGNLCKLQKLSLSGLYINQELTEFEWMFSGCINGSLESLYMAFSGLTGIIPESLGDLSKIKYLSLIGNKLSGPLPESLGRLSSLQKPDFSDNELNGTVPESLGQLSELIVLNLGSNFLNGVLSEVQFSGLNKLEVLLLYSNPLVLKVSPDWVPPFQLNYINMASCTVGPKFPTWLKSQVNLSLISMLNTGISDTIPPWFWNLTSKIVVLNLSLNKIRGKLPQSLIFATVTQGLWMVGAFVDLSSNLFDGPIPQILSRGIVLNLSNNSLSGSLPPNIENSWPQLNAISLSMNNISGSIPSSFCKMEDLYSLDLSRNRLSGKVPNCWSKFSYLSVINLANNNLSGGIPKTLCSLPMLNILHFQNNSLTGELPMSLKKCVNMYDLDLGQNKFKGNIPWWIGESLLNLAILRLDSNMFKGHIPPQLSHLTQLHILDLSANNLSGTILTIFSNFSAMKNGSFSNEVTSYGDEDIVTVIMKRRELEYKDSSVVSILMIIDLSSNHLSGNIPEEVANLSELQSLNLSRNLLTGQITERIGNLRQLQSLDLSSNMLSGSIPQSLSSLTFLEALDLSYNNLSGRIPQGNQLQTFIDPSIYAGNINLCGFPLNKKCQDDVSQATPGIMQSGSVEVEEDNETWFYAGMGLGIAAGFSIVWWLLIVKEAWRHAYFRFIDDIYDRLYVVVMINIARLKYKLQARRQGHTPSL